MESDPIDFRAFKLVAIEMPDVGIEIVFNALTILYSGINQYPGTHYEPHAIPTRQAAPATQ
jgi:hypothetical protein